MSKTPEQQTLLIDIMHTLQDYRSMGVADAGDEE